MTVGGIFLLADYFNYSAAVYNNTLFILGVTEDNTALPAFSIPVGSIQLADTICRSFAVETLASHPQLRYINCEDASGDPGLQQAKLAYHPIALLRKFNVSF